MGPIVIPGILAMAAVGILVISCFGLSKRSRRVWRELRTVQKIAILVLPLFLFISSSILQIVFSNDSFGFWLGGYFFVMYFSAVACAVTAMIIFQQRSAQR